MDTDQLVRDYLDRLHAASTSLPPHRRAELVGEVRDHITAAVAEAGRSDEVTVRNILERLGSPEEIVAGEAGHLARPEGAGAASMTGAAGGSSRWGAVEITALSLLGVAYPALFLPFGVILYLAMTVVGLVLVWASGVWSTRLKLIATVIVLAVPALYIALTTPTRVEFTDVGSPIVTTNE